MKHRTISATEFKAKCLALLDEIEKNGGTITVTKRGKPVATVSRAIKQRIESSEGAWVGKVEIVGDIVNFSSADLWEVLREPERTLDPKSSS